MEVGAVKQNFNNEVIQLKKKLNQAKIQIIHKLTRKAKTLMAKKKAPETVLEKNKRKAESAVNEVLILKKIKPKDIAKFTITHTGDLQEYLNKRLVDQNKACARLLLHKSLHDKYKFIRETYSNIPIKDLFMSREERRKLKKEARDKQKNKKDKKNAKVNSAGDFEVEDLRGRKVSVSSHISDSDDESLVDHNENLGDSDNDISMSDEEKFEISASKENKGYVDNNESIDEKFPKMLIKSKPPKAPESDLEMESEEEIKQPDRKINMREKGDSNKRRKTERIQKPNLEDRDTDESNDEGTLEMSPTSNSADSSESESEIVSEEEVQHKGRKITKPGKDTKQKRNKEIVKSIPKDKSVSSNTGLSNIVSIEEKLKPIIEKVQKQKKQKDQNPNKNKNLNDKLLNRKFKKNSEEIVTTDNKIVDPFFITSTGENYMSVVEPRAPDEVKEEHKQGNRKLRRAVMFGHVPKIKRNQNYESGYNKFDKSKDHNDRFNKYDKKNSLNNNIRQNGSGTDKFSRFNRQSDSREDFRNKNSKWSGNKADDRGRNSKDTYNSSGLQAKEEKLHPSWEAKKKQSSILPFQGKKIMFDEN